MKYGVIGFRLSDGEAEAHARDQRRAMMAERRANDGPIFKKMCAIGGGGFLLLMVVGALTGGDASESASSAEVTPPATDYDAYVATTSHDERYGSAAYSETPTYYEQDAEAAAEMARQRALQDEIHNIKAQLAERVEQGDPAALRVDLAADAALAASEAASDPSLGPSY